MENYIKSELEKYQKLGELENFVFSLMVSQLDPQLAALTDKKEMFLKLSNLGGLIDYVEEEPMSQLFENELFCKSVIGAYWENIVRYTEIEYPAEGEISFVLGVSENWKNDEEERLFICSDALRTTAGWIGELAEKAFIKKFLEEQKNQ